jgi:hypothetical protein
VRQSDDNAECKEAMLTPPSITAAWRQYCLGCGVRGKGVISHSFDSIRCGWATRWKLRQSFEFAKGEGRRFASTSLTREGTVHCVSVTGPGKYRAQRNCLQLRGFSQSTGTNILQSSSDNIPTKEERHTTTMTTEAPLPGPLAPVLDNLKMEYLVDAVQHIENIQAPQAPAEHLRPTGCKIDTEKKERWFVGSIDQGTTSSRFLIFDEDGEPVASHQIEFENMYPQSG